MTIAQHKNKTGIVKRAKELRQNGSMIERILWQALRESSKKGGLKFRYQHPFSQYVVDFVCLPAKLVVEIDGESHDSRGNEDEIRQQYIERLGYKFIRFTNKDVLNDLEAVVTMILKEATTRLFQFWEQNPSPKTLSPSGIKLSTLPQGEGA